MNQRQKQTSLKYLLNEVTNQKRMHRNMNNKMMKFTIMQEAEIDGMLNSGFFTLQESTALRVLFAKTNTKAINEMSVKKLDESVKILRESFTDQFTMTEGWLGDIWDGIKDLGNKAKDAITSGWDKVKAIWGEFKEITAAFIDTMIEFLKKAFEKAKKQGVDFLNKGKNAVINGTKKVIAGLDTVAKKKEFATELTNADKTYNFIMKDLPAKFISKNSSWAKMVESGNGTPEDTAGLNPNDAEKAIEDLKQEESVISKTRAELMSEKTQLLSDKRVLRELYNSYTRRLNEGGGSVHIEDALGNGFTKKIVKFCIDLMQLVMIPIAKLASIIAKAAGPAMLSGISTIVSNPVLGGPGAFKFAALGLILAEVLEIVIKFIAPTGPELATEYLGMLIPGLGALIAAKQAWITGIKIFLMTWTISTILLNLLVLVRKEYTESQANKTQDTGEEPEVQTAGYKPNGKFKLKEGKLVFVS